MVVSRAMGWALRLGRKAQPDRRAYLMCAMRIAASYAILWGVPHLPLFLQSPIAFFGNLSFYAGVLAIIGPAEQTVVNGVLDKAEDLWRGRNA